jgi:hypothetical protein
MRSLSWLTKPGNTMVCFPFEASMPFLCLIHHPLVFRPFPVPDCQPEIAGLPALVQQLNDSNDFSAFVQTMRRNFKAMV